MGHIFCRRPTTPVPAMQQRGFTLVELLISVVIGGVIIAAAASAIVSQIRSSARQEAVIRLQDHWARANLLLTNEIAEAETVAAGGANCSGVTPQLSLTVPSGTTTPGVISYAVDGNSVLWRCGPTVLANGSLDFTTASTSRLVEGAALTVAVDAGGRLPTYTLSLTDATGATFANNGSANRSRTRVID